VSGIVRPDQVELTTREGGPRRTSTVTVRLVFRFAGVHSNADAVHAAEERLFGAQGGLVTDVHVEREGTP